MEALSYIAFAAIVVFIAYKVYKARNQKPATGTGGKPKLPADRPK